ncbi:hypothetical protein [Paraburkholderia atlantica]|uniref:hypothetical protein n=1 Tax=Paraburkholderia atlantica TaxID=2654982 RepID=UPI0016221E0D|nr:hypothetical protein [Paraburkholderia atlantica]MBB5506945.1 hypothetical protein [Paraburkholderia atlantica]
MADIEQFKVEDLEDDSDRLAGGRRSYFMDALGEAVYACAGGDQQDRIISAYLTLQGVFEANSDNFGDEGDTAVKNATREFNEAVGKILGM